MTLRWPSIPRCAAAGLLGGLGGLALGGCVDPQGRFDDFTTRPLVAREASAPDNSVPDAGASEASRTPCQDLLAQDLNAQYYTSCLPTATGLPFALVIDQRVTPSADGMTGTLDFSFTPVKLTATDTSQTVGSLVVLPPTPIDAQCSFVEKLDSLTLPKEANALDRDLVADNVELRGRILSTERSCAGLDGTVTLIGLLLKGSVDHCIFIRTPPGGPIPTVTPDDYLCDPGPLSDL